MDGHVLSDSSINTQRPEMSVCIIVVYLNSIYILYVYIIKIDYNLSNYYFDAVALISL